METGRFPWKWRLSDIEQPGADAPTVFSVFACGGGSSMGYKRAGFRVLGCCEIDPAINAIYKQNLHPRFSYAMDVRDFNKLDEYPDELMSLDVLDGSPPCSTFSMAGDRERAWGKQKRFAEGQKLQTLDDLFFVFLETVERLRPKVVVAENVKGLIQGNAKGYVNEIIRRFGSLGYDVQLFLLNASRMGVPQMRERVFFVANRMGYGKLRLDFRDRPVTFGEVREPRGKPMKSADMSVYREARHGETSLKNAMERTTGKGSRFNEVLLWDDCTPATLCASGVVTRMCDLTRATPRDLLNIATFPQDYAVQPNKAKFVAGMSVPPSMMANVAHEIKRQWLEV